MNICTMLTMSTAALLIRDGLIISAESIAVPNPLLAMTVLLCNLIVTTWISKEMSH